MHERPTTPVYSGELFQLPMKYDVASFRPITRASLPPELLLPHRIFAVRLPHAVDITQIV